ncbi:MAG: copper resistance system multicopper oxidase [Halieaceae bacterium]
MDTRGVTRRKFVTGIGVIGAASAVSPGLALASSSRAIDQLSGHRFALDIGYRAVNFTGVERLATTVNGGVPGPVLRWREGDRVTLDVRNHLSEDTSIHWHGMILPTDMDGVPGMSFAGIKPGESFRYEFDVRQCGTYWYHSHSGFQEQTGLYGAIVIEPREAEPFPADREHVLLLSDWTDDDPASVYARLKKLSHYYNFQERTVADTWQEIRERGVSATWRDRKMWNQMRMSDSDLADVTGYTYTYLMNGVTPADGWRGAFERGETVKLRFINGSAMSIFDVRIPGLKMQVIASDGQPVEPVTVDEFRIGTAETYDVLVEPDHDSAYTIFAQTLDRTGFARGTLTPDPSLVAEVPLMDPAPTLGPTDMGMGGHTGHSTHFAKADADASHSHSHNHNDIVGGVGLAAAGGGSKARITHGSEEFGPHVDMRAENPVSGIDDPGVGLRHHQHHYGRRVLNYADLKSLNPTEDPRDPTREIQLHITGNMSRYMWSFNGVKFADAEPIELAFGERVRFHLVNDTMMTHPIHLHGLWSELETGDGAALPRKHTVLVQPGKTASYLVSANAVGRWAYHCHMQFHMMGMMREVKVT